MEDEPAAGAGSANTQLSVLPEDMLEALVLTLNQCLRRPQALVALTSTCHVLHSLRPQRLQKDSVRDQLSFSLPRRPSSLELVCQGIFKAPPGVNAHFVEAREELRREMTRNSLFASFKRRPSAEVLHQKGIMKGASCCRGR